MWGQISGILWTTPLRFWNGLYVSRFLYIFSLPTGELCQIILKLDFDNLVKRIKIESKKGKTHEKKEEGARATLANTQIHYATNQNFKLKLIGNAEVQHIKDNV